jgi:hypothetical protein
LQEPRRTELDAATSFDVTKKAAQGRLLLDYTKFHEVDPEEL